jgi:hypothetical protein
MSVLSKRAVFEEFLALGTVGIVAKVNAEGVELPELVRKPALTLSNPGLGIICKLTYNLNFKAPPITGLEITDQGVRANLSFYQKVHPTFIPWFAVFVIYQEENDIGVQYNKDAPTETKEQAPTRPKLSLV